MSQKRLYKSPAKCVMRGQYQFVTQDNEKCEQKFYVDLQKMPIYKVNHFDRLKIWHAILSVSCNKLVPSH